MRLSLLVLAVALAAPGLAARGTQWSIDGKAVNVDTTFHAVIGPGVSQTNLRISGGMTLTMCYTVTDLDNPYNDVRVVLGQDKLVGCQTLSSMQKQHDREGARHISGVNADFFSGNAPIGSTISDGRIFQAVSNTWSSWFLTADKTPGIGYYPYTGNATFPDGSAHAINGINCGRGENQLIVYDTTNGSTSGTNQYGVECGIVPVSGQLAFSGKCVARVVTAPATPGNMAIPEGGYVLAGHGNAKAQVENLKVGDEVTLDFYPALNNADIRQMASGTPLILVDGVIKPSTLDVAVARHPRTAVGYTADSKKLVLLVVDGRTSLSQGVTCVELASIMQNIGVHTALNLDGGGSSELYTTRFGVRNNPSDGNERAVTNAIFNVVTSPEDNEIASLAFTATEVTLPKYGYYTPQLYGYNKYGALVDTDVKGYTLSAPAEMGEIINDGTTLFANGGGYNALTATLPNGVKGTVAVKIGAGQPQARLESVITDSYRDYDAEIIGEVDGLAMPVGNQALEWQTSDAAVATVDDLGRVHGVANGTATITGTVDGMSANFTINVEIPQKRRLNIDPARDLSAWTVNSTGMYTDQTSVSKIDDNAFAVKYSIKNSRSSSVSVRVDKPMYALPDSVRLVFNPGQGTVKKISIEANAPGVAKTTVTVNPPSGSSFETGKNHVVLVPVSDFVDVADFASYPLNFLTLQFSTGGKVNTPQAITVKALEGVYTALPLEDAGVDDIIADEDANASVPVQYYDLQGRRSTATAPGLYLKRQGTRTAKVLVK